MTTHGEPDLTPDPAADIAQVVPLDAVEHSPQVTQFLAELRTFADTAAPAPSAELAALLAGASPLRPASDGAPPRRHWRRSAIVAAAAAVAAVGFTGVAAANESLPQPAQRVVSNVVNDLTPFHLNPDDVKPTPPADLPAPSPMPSQDADDDDGRKPEDGTDSESDDTPSQHDDDARDDSSEGPGSEEEDATDTEPSLEVEEPDQQPAGDGDGDGDPDGDTDESPSRDAQPSHD